jgi:homoserine O-succinyltransferase
MTSLAQPMKSNTYTLPRSTRRAVTVGLINNMGDEALKVTERQFASLLSVCAPDIDIRLRLFALNRMPRSSTALEYIKARYEPASSAMRGELDALIITGAQPRTARLCDESYWPELIEIIEWAKENTTSTIFSCLAAHAGVLHLDAIERRPLSEKRVGVFAFKAQNNHAFVGEQGNARAIPHSRYNDLLQSDLELAGYDVLTSSAEHGVDTFTKSFGSQFVFFQGHPEYDANSLAREYRRDLGRYLRRETEATPALPTGYFSAEAEAELRELERRAREDTSCVLTEVLAQIDRLTPLQAGWRHAATAFFRRWIETIVTSTPSREAVAACPAPGAAVMLGV